MPWKILPPTTTVLYINFSSAMRGSYFGKHVQGKNWNQNPQGGAGPNNMGVEKSRKIPTSTWFGPAPTLSTSEFWQIPTCFFYTEYSNINVLKSETFSRSSCTEYHISIYCIFRYHSYFYKRSGLDWNWVIPNKRSQISWRNLLYKVEIIYVRKSKKYLKLNIICWKVWVISSTVLS